MATKKKKKKKKNINSSPELSVSALEEYARRNLTAGNFRQAREYCKKLLKHDREQYLPLLIASYQGLVRQMLEQGLMDEAGVVLSQIKKLTGENEAGNEEIMLAMRKGNFSDAAKSAMDCLSKISDKPEPENQVIADAIVLAFKKMEFPESAHPSLEKELMGIHDALGLLTEEKYEEAMVALRPIGTRSIFSHWKLFIKGLVAFYRLEDEKADMAFKRLPSESMLVKAAEPYLILLKGKEGLKKHSKKQDVLNQVIAITGRQEFDRVLPRSEYLWQVGRFRDSYHEMQKKLPNFPTENPGIEHTLSVFYYNSLLHMDTKHADNYLKYLIKNISITRGKNRIERYMVHRAECLYLERDYLHDSDMIEIWDNFLMSHERVYGENAHLKAIVYARLGNFFSIEEKDDSCFFSPFRREKRHIPQLRNFGLAKKYYEEAVKLNPGDRDQHFSLLRFYEKTGEKAKLNRELDEIVRLFPEDKESLFKAGLGCIDRNAFQKGMKYLEQALKLDPLDGNLRESFIVACIKTALKHAQKSQIDRFRSLLPQALESGISDSDHLNCGHAYLYARWTCFELLNNQVQEAGQCLTRALNITKDDLRIAYFYRLIAQLYGVEPKHLKETKERIDRDFSGKAVPEKVVIFMEVVSYFWNFSNPLNWLTKETNKVNGYAVRALKQDCSRDDAKTIVEFAFMENGNTNLAGKYINKMLKKNKDDPLFLFYRYHTRWMNQRTYRLPGKNDLKELKDILLKAERDNDPELIAKVSNAIESLEKELSFLDAPDWLDDIVSGPDDFEDDDFDFEDDDFDPGEIFPRPIPRKPRKQRPKKKKKSADSEHPLQLHPFDEDM